MTTTQSVWHRNDIAQIARVLIAHAPSEEFARGVAALAAAVGAEVRLPPRVEVWTVEPAGLLSAGR